jgi:hypothetical protein
MSNLSTPLETLQPILSTLSPEQIRTHAEAIFPELLQIAPDSRPEERAAVIVKRRNK